jgi:hypothetical protein
MRKRTKAFLCAALSAAGLAVAPGPASASAAQCSTDYDHICLWVDINYNTGYGAWAGSVAKLPTALHGKVSSLKNLMPGAVYFYSDDNQNGSYLCINPGDVDANLTDNYVGGRNFNDLIKSFRYYPGGFCTLP